jgi:hypothetical protein
MTALMRARDPDEVRAAMQERGNLTYRELGRLARVSYGTVNNILDGKVTSREVARRVARSLNRGLDALFAPAAANDKQQDDKQAAAKDVA